MNPSSIAIGNALVSVNSTLLFNVYVDVSSSFSIALPNIRVEMPTPNSSIVMNIKGRIKTLTPLIKEKQLNAFNKAIENYKDNNNIITTAHYKDMGPWMAAALKLVK